MKHLPVQYYFNKVLFWTSRDDGQGQPAVPKFSQAMSSIIVILSMNFGELGNKLAGLIQMWCWPPANISGRARHLILTRCTFSVEQKDLRGILYGIPGFCHVSADPQVRRNISQAKRAEGGWNFDPGVHLCVHKQHKAGMVIPPSPWRRGRADSAPQWSLKWFLKTRISLTTTAALIKTYCRLCLWLNCCDSHHSEIFDIQLFIPLPLKMNNSQVLQNWATWARIV